MDKEQMKKIIDNPPKFEESQEDSLLTMVGQLYSKEMFPSFIVHGIYSLPFLALAVYSGIKFFRVTEGQCQLMHLGLFICAVQFIIFSKVKYWQMMHKNNVSREIKRLELRIAELNETVNNK